MMGFRTIKVRIRIVVEPDEGRFHAYCPDLKGLHVDGDTEREALDNAKDAAHAYLRSLLKHDDPIPVGVLQSDEKKSVGDLLREIFNRIAPTRARSHVEELSVAA